MCVRCHILYFVLDYITHFSYYGKWMAVIAGDLKYGIHFLFFIFLRRILLMPPV
jgi:hypothetical protein